jgi:hypothetical protein
MPKKYFASVPFSMTVGDGSQRMKFVQVGNAEHPYVCLLPWDNDVQIANGQRFLAEINCEQPPAG